MHPKNGETLVKKFGMGSSCTPKAALAIWHGPLWHPESKMANEAFRSSKIKVPRVPGIFAPGAWGRGEKGPGPGAPGFLSASVLGAGAPRAAEPTGVINTNGRILT